MAFVIEVDDEIGNVFDDLDVFDALTMFPQDRNIKALYQPPTSPARKSSRSPAEIFPGKNQKRSLRHVARLSELLKFNKQLTAVASSLVDLSASTGCRSGIWECPRSGWQLPCRCDVWQAFYMLDWIS